MRWIAAVVIVLASCAAAPSQDRTATHAPRFADYPEKKLSSAHVTKPFVARTRNNEEYRLRLLDAVSRDDKANFAGRYFVAKWSCGSACIDATIVDAPTGKVIQIPFTVSGWRETHDRFEPIQFRHNSRLIVFSGERNEKGDMGQHFYMLEKGKLKFLKTISNDGNFLKAAE